MWRVPTALEARKTVYQPALYQPAVGPSLHAIVWGPISRRASARAGTQFPVSSVVVRPIIPEGVRQAVLAVVPSDVIPKANDTAKTLKQRLAQSTFLEDSHVLKDGSGPARVRLLAEDYPQPRRRSWSVQVEPGHTDPDGDHVTKLFNYTAYGRLPADWEAQEMPRPVFDLGVAVWHSVFSFLTPQSQMHPPTHCQLLLYYVLFNGAMGRHRDNFTSKQMQDVVLGKRSALELVEGSHHGGDSNSREISLWNPT